MIYPDKETVEIYMTKFDIVPIYKKVDLKELDVISLYSHFRDDYTFLLESGEHGKNGRYSIIGLKSNKRYIVDDKIRMLEGSRESVYTGNPLKILESIMKKESPIYPELPVFTGGAIGHFNYEVIKLFEEIPDENPDTIGSPLMNFGFVEELLVIDHKIEKIFIIKNIQNLEEYDDAENRIFEIEKELLEAKPFIPETDFKKRAIHKYTTKEEFMKIVEKAKEYIYDGDIFQVVLSQRLSCDFDEDPFLAYCKLRTLGKSPYMYYLDFKDYVVAGVSPELLLKSRGQSIQTMPIAGTRPRGKTAEEDERLAESLRRDPKENAEHMMLVDLGRNDISKYSSFNSVYVSNMKEIQYYSHVMHMTSVVNGKLRDDKTAIDAFSSILPAGTLSGAPKIRAMEIIDELEKLKRGIYGGAIGFIGYNGQFDTCITIRTFVFKDNKINIQAGAGIVKDSVPETEYNECLHKSAALLSAVNGVI